MSPYCAISVLIFQSTLPARGATNIYDIICKDFQISIHAPRTGSDPNLRWWKSAYKISIHAPRTGSDHAPCASFCHIEPFQSTLPARGATWLR